MDYEKKYKEAMNWMRELYPGLHGATKEDAEHYFPELRESEDERIRKELISFITDIKSISESGRTSWAVREEDAKMCDDFLAWLEKQNNCLACDQHLKGYIAGRKATEEEKQKEQKPEVKYVYPKFRVGEEIVEVTPNGYCPSVVVKYIGEGAYRCESKDGKCFLSFPIKYENEYRLVEQKPAQTSDEKEYVRTIKSIISDFVRDNQPKDVAFYQKIYDWLDGRHIEQKPNIELIQRSWYMEGYNDRKFGNEPKWIIKTGEGGPKYEENPKYGQMLEVEKKPAEINEYEIIKKHITEDSLSSEVNKRLTECGWYVTEQKPAEWSEEDEKYRKILLLALNDHPLRTDELAAFNWLKSLRPQAKQEWNKTDKTQLLQLIEEGVTKSLCRKGFHFHFDEEYAKDLIEYICSFNPSKSNWKPSDEQMKALDSAINYLTEHTCTPGNPLLISLYHGLQKLL